MSIALSDELQFRKTIYTNKGNLMTPVGNVSKKPKF